MSSSSETLDRWDTVLQLRPVDSFVANPDFDPGNSEHIANISSLLGLDGGNDEETDPEILREYERLASEVVVVSAAVNPFKAAEDNIFDFAGKFPPLNANDVSSQLDVLGHLEEEMADFLERLVLTKVSFDYRVRVAHLLHKLRSTRYRLESPQQSGSPHKHVEPLGDLVCNLLREGYAPSESEHAACFTQFFFGLPSYLNGARDILSSHINSGGHIFAGSLEAAKETIPQIIELLQTDVEARFPQEFASSISRATQDLQQFLAFLEGLTGHPTEGFAVGKDALRDIYKYERGFGDINPDDLVQLGREEIPVIREKILGLRRRLAEKYRFDTNDNMSQSAFMKKLRPSLHLGDNKEDLLTLCRGAFKTANDYFVARDDGSGRMGSYLVPVRDCPIDVKNAPAFLQKYGFMVRFPNLFDSAAELPTAEYLLGADELKPDSNPLCSLEALLILATHEVTPGHINQAQAIKRHPDIALRTGSPDNIALIEGWGLFAEEIAYDAQFFPYAAGAHELDPDILELFYWQLKLLRAGRMVADPSLQTGAMTQEGVERFLIDECMQDPAFAKGQASYYPMMPGYASTYYPGHMFLRSLRDFCVDLFRGSMREEEARLWFYRTYLDECGTMAAPLVSHYVVGRALQEKAAREKKAHGKIS